MGPQSYGSLNFGNFETLEAKWHLGVGSIVMHKVYYKGEGGVLPQFWAVVSFVSFVNPCFFVVHLCTKVPQLRINQFIVGFV
jgi:hypothetical protein